MANRKRKARNWARDKQRDVYTRRARDAGYRSRSAYKLQEIDEQDRLFKGVRRVLDLGAAPGGWSQYARSRCPGGKLVAVDLLPMDPIDGVVFVQGDFNDPEVRKRLEAEAAPESYDLVICDMAPNITGIPDVDQANVAGLVEQAITFSARILAKNGKLLVKLFEGREAAAVRRLGGSLFQHAAVRKPGASRSKSREIYLVLRQPRESTRDQARDRTGG